MLSCCLIRQQKSNHLSFDKQKDGIPFTMNAQVLSAFIYLLSRHPSTIKNATFVIRMEWNDISTAINAAKKKNRPQSPWGAIPSLSIPADPTQFAQYIWPKCPFQITISDEIKQYLQNNSDKITVVQLKALDLASIAIYGLVKYRISFSSGNYFVLIVINNICLHRVGEMKPING